ncbi:DUF6206 family protein [Streptomyces sp. NPDC001914]|uniref:DUF6206 family protein n=1 Tax=Streptomyces sp. NPDC001914 TaxID=3364623 RepID=UPI0036BBAEC7
MNTGRTVDQIAHVHRRLEAAIEAGHTGDLRVVGFGEITLAVSWPQQEPSLVVKRLPPFRGRSEFDAYHGLLTDWTAEMERRGVGVVETELHAVDHPRWGVLGYLVQPLLRAEDLAVERVRRGSETESREVLAQVVAAIAAAVDGSAALDAQLPNWCVRADGSLAIMDVSTPFLRDTEGRDRLSTDLFVRGYPALLRPLLASRVLPSVIDAYHTPRTAFRDFAGNLIRTGFDRHLPFALEQAATVLGVDDLTEAEVRESFAQDARMWGVLQTLRRSDRWWQRTVRRRPYPALLPPKYDSRTDHNSGLRD